jgi:hypothetical protein
MKKSIAAITAFLWSSIASAQIVSIGPFTGSNAEGFESAPVAFQHCIPQRVFDDNADMCAPGFCSTVPSWSYACTMNTHGGARFYGSSGGATTITLDQPAYRFGGWFGTNCGVPDMTVTFFDASGATLLSTPVTIAADCNWSWHGWKVAGGAPFKSVSISSNYFNHGYVMLDDLAVDFSPGLQPPTGYCTSGTSANGCAASITANANPNVAHSNNCQITVTNVDGQRTGIIFYGLAPTAVPWCAPGGSNVLCVKSPTARTGVQSSGGTINQCNGSLSRNWNQYQLNHLGSLGAPWISGEHVFVQGWFRDPLACKTTSLSNALELTYVP